MMSDDIQPLNRLYPGQFLIPAALFLATILLLFGLYLPIITLKELVFWKSTFSVITGIISLFDEKHYVLAFIITLFSVCFPITKLTALFFIWFRPTAERSRNRIIEWMGTLGKWSMLDVFVVALTIIITKISKFASADARIGIYFFGASIILTMIITERINALLKLKQNAAGL